MLFNSNDLNDYENVLASINGFATGFDLHGVYIDERKLASILVGMRRDFPAQGGSGAASPFKKAANFLCYFIAEQPISTPFPEDVIGKQLASISNHQNSMVGLHVAIDALHNAVIFRGDAEVVLENRILMSKHSYVDIVEACAKISPSSHFHLISVLLEQMAYRFNSNACYQLDI